MEFVKLFEYSYVCGKDDEKIYQKNFMFFQKDDEKAKILHLLLTKEEIFFRKIFFMTP